MKALNCILPIAFGAAVLAGCSKNTSGNSDPEAGTPHITAALDEITSSEAVFTLTMYGDISEYAYAVLGGAGSPVPDAPAILSGDFTSAYNVLQAETLPCSTSDRIATVTFVFPQIAGYTFCAAAVSQDGILSEVAVIRIAASDIPMPQTLKTGKYMVHYTALTEEIAGRPVISEHSGEPFMISIIPWPNRWNCYMIGVEWFNITETVGAAVTPGAPLTVINPILGGTVDQTSNRIVFSGDYFDPADLTSGNTVDGNAFNSIFYWEDQAVGSGWAFMGGEDGTSPVYITFDEEGTPLTISSCGFAHYTGFRTDGQKIDAWFDAIWTEGTLVPFE